MDTELQKKYKKGLSNLFLPILDYYRKHKFSFMLSAFTLSLTGILFFTLIFYGSNTVKPLIKFLFDNLPLTLPILTVILSIASRPQEIKTLKGFLNTGNYFVLGLVSFSIWAYVAGQSSGSYIFISSDKVMKKEYSLILVLCSFIWAGFSAVVTTLSETNSNQSEGKNWQKVQSLIFAISFMFLFAPYYLFENKKDVEEREKISFDINNYKVTIVYRDQVLNKHIGLKGYYIDQAYTYKRIRAKTTTEAREIAKNQFEKSIISYTFNPRIMAPDSTNNRTKVDVFDDLITVEIEK